MCGRPHVVTRKHKSQPPIYIHYAQPTHTCYYRITVTLVFPFIAFRMLYRYTQHAATK